MTEHHFETHRPVHLLTELGQGSVNVVATDTTETHVEVTGRDAEDVAVRQDGDRISVVAPRQRSGFLGREHRLDVVVTLPTGSELTIRTGSADIDVSGTVAGGQLKSGSGRVRVDTTDAPLSIASGSGDVDVDTATAEVRVKSGSGSVRLADLATTSAVSTGSGGVQIGTNRGPVVVKTGSGDLEVREAEADVTLSTASGDLVVGTARRGRLTAKAVSGDVEVGIPAGVPVWTDISTVSGSIRSRLAGVGEPQDGADHVEVRAKTVSGNVLLTEV